MRRLVPLALLSAVLVAPTAHAAPKGCPLLSDPRADDRFHGTPLARPGDDLLSTDVWVDARGATAVLRLAGLPPKTGEEGSGPEAEGYEWTVSLRTPHGGLDLTVQERSGSYFSSSAYAADTAAGSSNVYSGEFVSGSADTRHGVLRVEVPMAVLDEQLAPHQGDRWQLQGVLAGQLDGNPPVVQSGVLVTPGGVVTPRDKATPASPVTVVVGSPRCRS